MSDQDKEGLFRRGIGLTPGSESAWQFSSNKFGVHK